MINSKHVTPNVCFCPMVLFSILFDFILEKKILYDLIKIIWKIFEFPIPNH